MHILKRSFGIISLNSSRDRISIGKILEIIFSDLDFENLDFGKKCLRKNEINFSRVNSSIDILLM